MSGGLLVMALAAAAIVSNALLLQTGRHPDPFFMTRGGALAGGCRRRFRPGSRRVAGRSRRRAPATGRGRVDRRCRVSRRATTRRRYAPPAADPVAELDDGILEPPATGWPVEAAPAPRKPR
jgi:hypothetical protein